MGTDPGGQVAADILARLREIETDLAALRAELGPPTGEPRDFGDAGEDLTARQQQAALIESLEGERALLRDRLDGS